MKESRRRGGILSKAAESSESSFLLGFHLASRLFFWFSTDRRHDPLKKSEKYFLLQVKMDEVDSLAGDTVNDTEEYDIYEYDLDESLATFNWSELGPSLFVFSVTFIVGILGNSLILVAVLRHTHVKSSPVNVFLASLASADLLLILVCLPLKVRI